MGKVLSLCAADPISSSGISYGIPSPTQSKPRALVVVASKHKEIKKI